MDRSQLVSHLTVGLVALLMVTAVVAAQSTGTVIDDFEDGDSDGWNQPSSGSLSVQESAAFEGQYGLEFKGSTSTASRGFSSSQYNSTSIYIRFNDYTDGGIDLRYDGNGGIGPSIEIDGAGNVLLGFQGEYGDSGINIQEGQFYKFVYEDLDFQNDTFDLKIVNGDSQKVVGTQDDVQFHDSVSDVGEIVINQDSSQQDFDIDFLGVNGVSAVKTVSGKVRDDSGDPIKDANVTVRKDGEFIKSAETNDIGYYQFDLARATYNLTASKTGYLNETKELEFGSAQSVIEFDFVLIETAEQIELNVRDFQKHAEDYPYSVVFENESGRYDISTQANVTSSDSNVLSIDDQQLRTVATPNTSVNTQVNVTAQFTDINGDSYATTRTVTVANETVGNLPILPPGSRIGASFGDQAIQLILIVTMLGAATALVGRAFAGLAGMALLFAMGWLGGYIGDGMVIVSFLMALFVGLNMAANIDYTVQG